MVQLRLFYILLVLTTFGCAGRGDVVILDLRSTPETVRPSSSQTAPIKIAVLPSEEEYPVHLWNRTHLWGGKTYYAVPGGWPVRVVSRMLVEHFNQRGWQAWAAATEKDSTVAGADVTIAGTVQDFSVNATSYFGRTWLEANVKMTIVVTNAKDGSTARMSLEHYATHRLFWFEPEDIQAIMQEVLTGALTTFVRKTRAEERSIRMG